MKPVIRFEKKEKGIANVKELLYSNSLLMELLSQRLCFCENPMALFSYQRAVLEVVIKGVRAYLTMVLCLIRIFDDVRTAAHDLNLGVAQKYAPSCTALAWAETTRLVAIAIRFMQMA